MSDLIILRGVYAEDGTALVYVGQPAVCLLQLTTPNPAGFGPDVPQDLTGRAFAQYILDGSGVTVAEAAGQILSAGQIRFTLDSATVASLLGAGVTVDLTHELVELVVGGVDPIMLRHFSIRTPTVGLGAASFTLNTGALVPTPLIVRYAGAPGPAGPTTLPVLAAVALASGDLVSFGPDGAVLADATDDTRPANGFVMAPVAAGAMAEVSLSGAVNSVLTGLTPSAAYYLGAAGAVTAVRPVSGALQIVGTASDATHLAFHYQPPVLL